MPKKQYCPQCKEMPDDLIVLSCDHSLCLNCCSKYMHQGQDQRQYQIKCIICQDLTVIDMILYQQIQQMTTKTNFIVNSIDNNKTLRNSKQNNQLNNYSNMNHEKKIKQTQFFEYNCQYHPQYAIMYACLDCCNNLICPQCVVNGIHKNHNVKSIQKESQRIKIQMTDLLNNIDNNLNDLYHQNQNNIKMFQNNICQVQMMKNQAKSKYQQIIKRILQEQKSVIDKCDQLIISYQNQINLMNKNYDKQINLMQQKRIDIIDIINPFMKENMTNSNKTLLKWHSITMMKQYDIFMKKYCQKTFSKHLSPSYINNFQKTNRSNIDEISKTINKISIDTYKSDIHYIKKTFQGQINKQKQKIKQQIIQKKESNIYYDKNPKLLKEQRKNTKNSNVFNLI